VCSRVDGDCQKRKSRLVTLHNKHPLTKMAKKCMKGKVKRHRSLLHHLANVYKADPNTFETISSAGRNPAHIGKQPFKTDILPSKEASKGTDTSAMQHIKVYTDRSAHRGNVGAATILTKDGHTIAALHYRLGISEEHTVFEAELVGLLLGLQLIKDNTVHKLTCTIRIDNQASIRALASKINKPGHYLAAKVIHVAQQLRNTQGRSSH
jgi:hypothetical protein